MAYLPGLQTQEIADTGEIERLALKRVTGRRTLFVLANAEMVLDTLRQGSAEARTALA